MTSTKLFQTSPRRQEQPLSPFGAISSTGANGGDRINGSLRYFARSEVSFFGKLACSIRRSSSMQLFQRSLEDSFMLENSRRANSSSDFQRRL